MEFFQGTGGADAHLYWASGCQNSQVIPQTQLYPGAPDAPTGTSATAGDSQVFLSWVASAGATGYNVKRSATKGGPYTTVNTAGPLPGTSYDDTGLTNGQAYFYVVTALNSLGESVGSAEVSATPVAAMTKPTAPTGLTATAGDGQVVLAWTTLPAANTYKVYRGGVAGGEAATPIVTGLTSAGYTDTTVTDGQTYFYQVSGVNSAGEGPRSTEVAATPNQPTINYPAPNGFTGTTGMQLNGTVAQITGSRLRLTDGQNWEADSAFYKTKVNVNHFVTSFQFQMATPNADGFTFCLQSVGTTALGANGGGLGYQNLGTPSAAIKFDLWDNSGEGTNSTGLFTNGGAPMTPATDVSPVNLHSGDIIQVDMQYNGTTLTVKETDTTTSATATQTYTVDLVGLLGSTAYAGFTAATGGAGVTTDILNWTFAPPTQITPVLTTITVTPGTVSLNGGATQTFTATAKDQFGQPLATQPAFVWSVDAGSVGSVNGSGLYSAGAVSGSATVRATVGGVSGIAGITVTAPPLPPTGLTATTISSSEIDLSWTNADASQTSLKLERSLDNGVTFSPLQTLAANATGWQDKPLTPATTYVYRIKGSNAAGDGTASATATATTLDVPPLQASNLTVSGVTSTQITLTWKDNANNETGFHIYRKDTTAGTFNLIHTVPASPGVGAMPTYQDTGLTPGTYYEYHLKAFNAVGEGGDFTGTNATTLSAAAASITLTPAKATLVLGHTQQFTATALDQSGTPLSPQPTLTWTASAGTLSSSGLYTPTTLGGPFLITVTTGSGANMVSKTATVTVIPAAFVGLTVTPTTVYGGQSATGTITFNGNVATDQTLSLTASNLNATLPATVTVPAGASSATFNIITAVSAADVTGTLSATLGTVTRSATLLVKTTPATLTSLSPGVVASFGPAFSLSVNGSGLLPGSVVQWNKHPLVTHYLSATQVSADVPASLLQTKDSVSIVVANGSSLSNALTLTVGLAHLTASATLSRDALTQEVIASVAVTNSGTADASSVQLTRAFLGGKVPTTVLPVSVGTVAAGGSVRVTLRFPSSVGAGGSSSVLSVGGVYPGYSFTTQQTLTLP